MDWNVPYGISLQVVLMVTLRVGSPGLLNRAWEPFCRIKKKPLSLRTFKTSFKGIGLGIFKTRWHQIRPLDLADIGNRGIFKMQLQRFL